MRWVRGGTCLLKAPRVVGKETLQPDLCPVGFKGYIQGNIQISSSVAIPSLGICRLLYLSALCPCGLFTFSQYVMSVLGPGRRWDCMTCWFLHFFLINHVPSWSSTWVKDPGPSSLSELTFCLFFGPLSTGLLRGLQLSLCRLVVGCLSSPLQSVPVWIVSCFSGHLPCERGKTVKTASVQCF